LYSIVRINRPSHIVETGRLLGISSAHFPLRPAREPVGHAPLDRPSDAADRTTSRRVRIDRLDTARPNLGVGDARRPAPGLGPASGPQPGRSSGARAGRRPRRRCSCTQPPQPRSTSPSSSRPFVRGSPRRGRPADNTEWTGDAFDRFARTLGGRGPPSGRLGPGRSQGADETEGPSRSSRSANVPPDRNASGETGDSSPIRWSTPPSRILLDGVILERSELPAARLRTDPGPGRRQVRDRQTRQVRLNLP